MPTPPDKLYSLPADHPQYADGNRYEYEFATPDGGTVSGYCRTVHQFRRFREETLDTVRCLMQLLGTPLPADG